MLFEYRGSVSDLLLFREEPALWVLKHHPDYLYRTESGPSAIRGNSVEYAFQCMLRFGLTPEQALPFAQRRFYKMIKKPDLEWSEKDLSEYHDMHAYLIQCSLAAEALGLGRYTHAQYKVEGQIEGVPMLGFIDFRFDHLSIDLKTTGRMPSAMKPNHVEQLAYYTSQTEDDFVCLYVTPKKWAAYKLSEKDYAWGMSRLQATMRAVKKIIEFDGWDGPIAIFPPRELGNFRWDEKSQFLATMVWEL